MVVYIREISELINLIIIQLLRKMRNRTPLRDAKQSSIITGKNTVQAFK